MTLDEKILCFVENYNAAFMVFLYGSEELIYYNKASSALFGICEDTEDLEYIFQDNEASLRQILETSLIHCSYSVLSDVITKRVDGKRQLANIQFGFFNDEKTEIYLEVSPKKDDELEVLEHILATSEKPSFLLNYDENLTVDFANKRFYNALFCDELLFQKQFRNSLKQLLVCSNQGSVVKKILAKLKDTTECTVEAPFLSENGEIHWYYLDLQKKNFLNGEVKLIGNLISLDHPIGVMCKLDNLNRQFEAIQKISTDTFFVIDVNTRILMHKGNYSSILGVSEVEPDYPNCVFPRIHPDDLKSYQEHATILLHGMDDSCIVRMKTASGKYEWFQMDATVLNDDTGVPEEIIGKILNIQEKDDVKQRATMDSLTHALNKLEMEELTCHILSQSQPEDTHALFFLDLDDFSKTISAFGHSFGDFLLVELSRRLGKNIRGGDILGRVGEDKFLLFLRDIPSKSTIESSAQRILLAINEVIFNGEQKFAISGSIGISVYPDHGTTYDLLFQHANMALCHAKELGKNKAMVYQKELKLNSINEKLAKEP